MENKTGKPALPAGRYFKYAIGEIILVVIGILIALQINTWNEGRKAIQEESNILQNLYDEFYINKQLLNTSKNQVNTAKDAGFKLMNLIAKEEKNINKHNTDSLLFSLIDFTTFRPSENTINDLIQSGRLKLLQNQKLKTLLYQWQSILNSTSVSFNKVELKVDDELVPYLSNNYALKDIDKYGALQWKVNSKLKIDKTKVFYDIKFENILDDYLYRIISAEKRTNEIESIINDILKETEY